MSPVEICLTSMGLVLLAEMGDRTQLLTMMLASRYGRPLTISAGVLAATLANHALAALAGFYLSSLLTSLWFRTLIGVSFIAMALWALVPDKESDAHETRSSTGVFMTTFISFFVVEMGDKTQIATAALAARFHDVVFVALGTTCGMMLANVPVAYAGRALMRVLPLKTLRIAAALIYLVLGVVSLAQTAGLI